MFNPFLFLLREFWLAGLRLVCLRAMPSWPKASPRALKTHKTPSNTGANVPAPGFLVALVLYALMMCMLRLGVTYDLAKAIGMILGFLVTAPILIGFGWPIFLGYLLISGFVDSVGIVFALAGLAEETRAAFSVVETLALGVLALRSFHQAQKER